MRSERERLLDILEAIQRIEKYATRGKTAFENDELVQNWMIHHPEAGHGSRCLTRIELRNG